MDSLIVSSLSTEAEEKTLTLVQGHLTLTLSFIFYLGYQPLALPLPPGSLFHLFSPFSGPLFCLGFILLFPLVFPLFPLFSPVPCPLGSCPSFLSTYFLPSSLTPHHPLGCPWVLRSFRLPSTADLGKVCTISFERPVNYLCDAWHVYPPKYEAWTHFNRP